MRLPNYLESELWVEILKFEDETIVRYVNSVARIGYKRGREGCKFEGKIEERIEAIEFGLSLKFGDNATMSQVCADSKEDKRQEWVISTARYSG